MKPRIVAVCLLLISLTFIPTAPTMGSHPAQVAALPQTQFTFQFIYRCKHIRSVL